MRASGAPLCLLGAALVTSGLGAAACRKASPRGEGGDASAAPGGSFGPPEAPPEPRKGMVWIPGGALVAGTPPDAFPRVADEEIPGEQLILHGFYMDVFPYPNEEGAIPLTNVTHSQAQALCDEQGKRLCTELEWERACKGPDNHVHEYGEAYKPERCGTGAAPSMRPNGLLVGCRSEFGVRDMHGGVWEWTDSHWGRGSERELYTIRGGNSVNGELVGRCANGAARAADDKLGSLGFRCCAGPKNESEVVLEVTRGEKLDAKEAPSKALASELMALLPEEAKTEIGAGASFRFEREWIWRPIGNEELHVLGGCSGLAVKPACGVVVARVTLVKPKVLAWVSTGHWAATLHMDADPRDLWLFGGDELGQFRRLVGYVWGKVSVGPKERKVPKPKPKKKKKK